MPIDPSIPLQLSTAQPQPPQNPLDVMGKAAALNNSMNQGKMFSQEMGARQAMGPIFQNAVDPETGELDINAVQKGMAADPRAAFKSPEVMMQLMQRELTKVQAQKEKLEVSKFHLETMNSALGSLSEAGENVTYDDVIKKMGEVSGMIGDPAFTKKMAAALADAPKGQGSGQPNSALATWIKQHQMQGLAMDKQMEAAYGKLEKLDNGMTQSFVRLNALKNTAEPTGQAGTEGKGLIGPAKLKAFALQNQMTPTQAAEPVQTINPETKETQIIPKGQFAQQAGVPGSGMPGGGGQVQAQPQPPAQPQATGSTPLQPPPQAQAQPQPLTPPAGPATAPVVKQAPADNAFQEAAGKDVAKYKEALDSRVQTGQQLMMRIEEQRHLLEKIRTGGGSEVRLNAAKAAQALGADNKMVDKIAGGDVGAAEEFRKFSVQSAVEVLKQSLAGAVGSKISQLEFDMFQKNNPNLETDPRAIEKIYNFMTRIYKMDSTEQKELGQYKGQITQWPTKWNERVQELGFFKPEEKEGYAKSGEGTVHWEVKDGKLVKVQ